MSLLMEKILTWLVQRPWVIKLALALVVLLLAATIGLGIALRVTTLQRDHALAQQAALSARVELQNQAVAQWQKEAEAQQQTAAAAEERATRLRTANRARVERVMAATVPTSCPEAVSWGAVQGAQLGRIWEGKDD